MGFWESIAGRALTEGTLPRIAKALEKCNSNFERMNKYLEAVLEDNKKWAEKRDYMTPEQLANNVVREDALEACISELLKHIFSEEVADHIPNEILHMACGLCDINIDELSPIDLWANDRIQFARLICELNATQSPWDYSSLRESMDLPNERIDELFERAHKAWEESKRNNT